MEKMVYKYEIHVHDCLCSACAHNLPEEMAEAYFSAGYSGMCFTNHFLRGNTAVDRRLPWAQKVHAYWDAYQRAVRWAEGKDFSVFFGIEHQYGGGKEVLTYGIDLDFLLAHPNLDLYTLDDYAKAVHEAGGFLAQAHPFREAGYIDPDIMPRPECLDGIEGFNWHNAPAQNDRAVQYAKAKNLYRTSGGDVHFTTDAAIGQAGMAFPYKLESSEALVKALFRHDGRCIVNGEIE